MKYRVRMDLSFASKADARLLMDYARALTGKAASINEGSGNEEISFCDLELCGHDEGKPCQHFERLEIRALPVKEI